MEVLWIIVAIVAIIIFVFPPLISALGAFLPVLLVWVGFGVVYGFLVKTVIDDPGESTLPDPAGDTHWIREPRSHDATSPGSVLLILLAAIVALMITVGYFYTPIPAGIFCGIYRDLFGLHGFLECR